MADCYPGAFKRPLSSGSSAHCQCFIVEQSVVTIFCKLLYTSCVIKEFQLQRLKKKRKEEEEWEDTTIPDDGFLSSPLLVAFLFPFPS